MSEDLDLTCPHCGCGLVWEDCSDCDDGYIDMYDDDPLWYEPDDVEPCSTCRGKSGWWYCPSANCKGKG